MVKARRLAVDQINDISMIQTSKNLSWLTMMIVKATSNIDLLNKKYLIKKVMDWNMMYDLNLKTSEGYYYNINSLNKKYLNKKICY